MIVTMTMMIASYDDDETLNKLEEKTVICVV